MKHAFEDISDYAGFSKGTKKYKCKWADHRHVMGYLAQLWGRVDGPVGEGTKDARGTPEFAIISVSCRNENQAVCNRCVTGIKDVTTVVIQSPNQGAATFAVCRGCADRIRGVIERGN